MKGQSRSADEQMKRSLVLYTAYKLEVVCGGYGCEDGAGGMVEEDEPRWMKWRGCDRGDG